MKQDKFFHEIAEGDLVWYHLQLLEVSGVRKAAGFTTLVLEDGSETTRSDFDQIKVV